MVVSALEFIMKKVLFVFLVQVILRQFTTKSSVTSSLLFNSSESLSEAEKFSRIISHLHAANNGELNEFEQKAAEVVKVHGFQNLIAWYGSTKMISQVVFDPGRRYFCNTDEGLNLANFSQYDIVYVDHHVYPFFVNNVLPILTTEIILVTNGNWMYYEWPTDNDCKLVGRREPPLEKEMKYSNFTEALLNHPFIAHWFAGQPAMKPSSKYTPTAYGVSPQKLKEYANIIAQQGNIVKNEDNSIRPSPVGSTHSSRQPLIDYYKRASHELKLSRYDFPDLMVLFQNEKFVMSPRGDMPETHRHYESIGVGAIPISNLNETLYRPIFGDSMIYVNDCNTMVTILEDSDLQKNLSQSYKAPDRRLSSSLYWLGKVLEKQHELKRNMSKPLSFRHLRK